MMRMVVMAALMLAPVAATAQSGVVAGQQNGRPSPNQNQPQMQTDNAQEPPQAHQLPPTASAQTQPNPLPQLSK
jgi:hypothetical protein